jgi:hypothetical protein
VFSSADFYFPSRIPQAMTMLNRQINLPALQETMMEFQKQSEVLEMKQEVRSSFSSLENSSHF